ncbi:hypothetical protein [Ralstonia phage RP12]|uniref:Uncharacterized protein n=1 Tax=Ralstonia phage RP12 TaxID=1923889 RepID=A0A1L7N1A0_9CAUD|nr:hypothetical protein FDH28_gp132 [Ralstonia phage RP12]BAW19263.1 hypothetical protein [Ralstonia phage RP12]
MQSLFRLDDKINTGSIELRQWRYAKDGLLQNVEKIEQFYQDYPIAVSGSHLLVRLIQSMNISRTLSFDRYVANCSARSLNVAQALKITSGLSKGQIWDGVFYGPGTKEIIIAHDTLFPLQDAWENWKSMHPVTVLLHNQSNTQLNVPDGRVNAPDKGVAVIAINVPMLMAMYYRFNQEQDAVELGGGERRTLYQFIHGYALAGMVRSHLDGVIFNRLFNKVSGVPNTDAIRKHSFFTNNYDSALDTGADMQIEYLRNLKKRFTGVMAATHLPVSGSLLEYSHLPSIPTTLQAFWAVVVSRIKIVAFLCMVQKDYEAINAKELETIRWMMNLNQTKQVIRNNLGMEAYFDVAPWLDRVGIE